MTGLQEGKSSGDGAILKGAFYLIANSTRVSHRDIPARHDVWRRAATNWLGGLTARHIIDMDDAWEMLQELAMALAKRAYNP
jgi:glucuronate isomerase